MEDSRNSTTAWTTDEYETFVPVDSQERGHTMALRFGKGGAQIIALKILVLRKYVKKSPGGGGGGASI